MYHTAGILENFTRAAKENGTSYDEEVEKFVKAWRVPSGKFGDIEDFGAFCALFCSMYANYTVGQNLVMDGGITNSTF